MLLHTTNLVLKLLDEHAQVGRYSCVVISCQGILKISVAAICL